MWHKSSQIKNPKLAFICFMTQRWLFEFHDFKIKIMMMDRFDLFTVTFFGFKKWSDSDQMVRLGRNGPTRSIIGKDPTISES